VLENIVFMRDFKKLDIWNDSRKLVKQIYLISKDLPETEKIGLISQINRSVISIPANIAEGSAKNSQKDFKRFLHISLGSAFELETLLILCEDLNFIEKSKLKEVLMSINILQKKNFKFN
jgi:four helix bundle protein